MPSKALRVSNPPKIYRHSLLALLMVIGMLCLVGLLVILLWPPPRSRDVGSGSRSARSLTLTTSDHVQISASLYESSETPNQGVVLVPMVDGTRNDWDEFATSLTQHQRVALAFDWRKNATSGSLSNQDWPLLEQDVHASLQYLHRHYPGLPIILIGASLGANFSIKAALSTQPSVDGMVLLSPGLSYRGIDISSDIGRTAQPLLIVVSEEDEYAQTSSLTLFNASGSLSKSMKHLSDAGHGTAMLNKEPRLGQDIMNWMAQL